MEELQIEIAEVVVCGAGASMGRWQQAVCGAVVAVVVGMAVPASGQKTPEMEKLNAAVLRLYGEGKYGEAIPLAQKALALREKAVGAEHHDVGALLNNLARLFEVQGRYGEAEPLHKRSLAME